MASSCMKLGQEGNVTSESELKSRSCCNAMACLGRNKRNHSTPAQNQAQPRPSTSPADCHDFILNQYKFRRLLGKGSQGIVCLALDAEQKCWAVKIVEKKRPLLRRGARNDGHEKDQVKDKAAYAISGQAAREIAILKKLDHPNIIRLHEVLDSPTDDKVYIVMQHVNGGPVMEDREEQTPLSEQKARDLFRQLIKGLEYLHYHGIIHRDIKPSNLMVTKTGLLKIGDFGVSAICEPELNKSEQELNKSEQELNKSEQEKAEKNDITSKPKLLKSDSGGSNLDDIPEEETVDVEQVGKTPQHDPPTACGVSEEMLSPASDSRSANQDGGGVSDEIETSKECDIPDPPKLTLKVSSSFYSSVPFVTPRTAAAAQNLDPKSEEYKRLYGKLYPPTPAGIDDVRHNDTMSAEIGTLSFFSPERCSASRYKGKDADLWAAGISLYIFLFGKLPFSGSSKIEIYSSIKNEPLKFPANTNVSKDAMELLSQILSKNPVERPSIQTIKRSRWVRKGGGKFGLSPYEASVIDVTAEEMSTAVTEIDLSIGVTPMVRSKSWTAKTNKSSMMSNMIKASNSSEMEVVSSSGTDKAVSKTCDADGFRAGLEEHDVKLHLETDLDIDNTAYRPLSVPARQIREERLKEILHGASEK